MSEPISLIHVVRPSEGGIQTHVVGLACRLPSSRVSQLVAGALTRDFQAALSRCGVTWSNLPVPSEPQPRALLAAGRQLRRLLADRTPQIVHAHGYTAGAAAAWAVRGLQPRPKLVLTAHVFPTPRSGAGWARGRALRWLFRSVDRGIAVSQAVRRAVLEHDPSGEERWTVIYNGIDPRPFERRIDPGAKRRELGVDPATAVIGVVARLSEEKGVDVFLRAAAQLMREVPNVDFVIVGEGPAREALERLAHDLHLTGQVLFLGRRRDVPEILGALDVLVVPSREESFGLAALEGIAAGVPVVASEVGGLREILDGVSSVTFVPPDDVPALVAAMERELTTVSLDESDHALEVVLPGGGIHSLADMLVSEHEYDLDRMGLDRQRQITEAAQLTERERLLERLSIRHMVRDTLHLYEELAQEAG
jgi:glycosyltransferase involved in cell wall biosynthesis